MDQNEDPSQKQKLQTQSANNKIFQVQERQQTSNFQAEKDDNFDKNDDINNNELNTNRAQFRKAEFQRKPKSILKKSQTQIKTYTKEEFNSLLIKANEKKKEIVEQHRKIKEQLAKPRCKKCDNFLNTEQSNQETVNLRMVCDNCLTKCKKCQKILPEEYKSDICQECKQKQAEELKKKKLKICIDCDEEFEVKMFRQMKCMECKNDPERGQKIKDQKLKKEKEEQQKIENEKKENQAINNLDQISNENLYNQIQSNSQNNDNEDDNDLDELKGFQLIQIKKSFSTHNMGLFRNSINNDKNPLKQSFSHTNPSRGFVHDMDLDKFHCQIDLNSISVLQQSQQQLQQRNKQHKRKNKKKATGSFDLSSQYQNQKQKSSSSFSSFKSYQFSNSLCQNNNSNNQGNNDLSQVYEIKEGFKLQNQMEKCPPSLFAHHEQQKNQQSEINILGKSEINNENSNLFLNISNKMEQNLNQNQNKSIVLNPQIQNTSSILVNNQNQGKSFQDIEISDIQISFDNIKSKQISDNFQNSQTEIKDYPLNNDHIIQNQISQQSANSNISSNIQNTNSITQNNNFVQNFLSQTPSNNLNFPQKQNNSLENKNEVIIASEDFYNSINNNSKNEINNKTTKNEPNFEEENIMELQISEKTSENSENSQFNEDSLYSSCSDSLNSQFDQQQQMQENEEEQKQINEQISFIFNYSQMIGERYLNKLKESEKQQEEDLIRKHKYFNLLYKKDLSSDSDEKETSCASLEDQYSNSSPLIQERETSRKKVRYSNIIQIKIQEIPENQNTIEEQITEEDENENKEQKKFPVEKFNFNSKQNLKSDDENENSDEEWSDEDSQNSDEFQMINNYEFELEQQQLDIKKKKMEQQEIQNNQNDLHLLSNQEYISNKNGKVSIKINEEHTFENLQKKGKIGADEIEKKQQLKYRKKSSEDSLCEDKYDNNNNIIKIKNQMQNLNKLQNEDKENDEEYEEQKYNEQKQNQNQQNKRYY
ncbi:hypothetical protein PPERSA_01819 [Pseudocohnilembus persalinus]|uniref:Uncharacterized protein n=1 Tax=Pseudocohnilembus persalinus TaxID=266149 RepID=A0A0V0QKC9_PSEPJ|nr:hypothetical protein PPERSA_01819 [Pseudocohnilembus persalinus]|eukprot:KRX02702.1 hypothetical protein PPERSA_01819 [Pseudocohnilembus persalinus]